MSLKARIFASGATVALAGGMGLAGTTAASAAPAATTARSATIGCAATTYCGSQDLKFGHYALDVKGQRATYGNTVILWTRSNTDPAQDFIFKNYNGLSSSTGGGSDKTFEYAPNGRASNLCLSFPSETRGSGGVLRNCNESIWQTFEPLYVDGTYVGWKNQASGYVMEDGGFQNQGTQVDQWTYNGGDNQEWKYVS